MHFEFFAFPPMVVTVFSVCILSYVPLHPPIQAENGVHFDFCAFPFRQKRRPVCILTSTLCRLPTQAENLV